MLCLSVVDPSGSLVLAASVVVTTEIRRGFRRWIHGVVKHTVRVLIRWRRVFVAGAPTGTARFLITSSDQILRDISAYMVG
jgi:hypothetical protein